MSRPLNKKYFGNRNVGSASTSADDGIGGEGVASINWSQLGSFRGNNGANNPLVGFELPAPTLPGGVQATWSPTFEVASVTTGAGSVGLVVGDTYTYAGLGSPVITVATSGNNGTNATFTVTAGGEFDLSDMPGDTTGVNITKVSGSGANTFQVDINFKVKAANIVEPGSGYKGTETFTVTLYAGATGTAPAGTIVKTASNNNNAAQNPTGTNENAIIGYAYIDGGREVVDIVAQKGSKRYIVTGADGTINTAMLIADTASAEGEMEIRATDSDGGTYWVTKLTSRLAVVEPDSGTQFASGQRVKWNLVSASEDVSVKVENA